MENLEKKALLMLELLRHHRKILFFFGWVVAACTVASTIGSIVSPSLEQQGFLVPPVNEASWTFPSLLTELSFYVSFAFISAGMLGCSIALTPPSKEKPSFWKTAKQHLRIILEIEFLLFLFDVVFPLILGSTVLTFLPLLLFKALFIPLSLKRMTMNVGFREAIEILLKDIVENPKYMGMTIALSFLAMLVAWNPDVWVMESPLSLIGPAIAGTLFFLAALWNAGEKIEI